MSADGFDDLTTRAAWLYHQRGWTQEQIARKFRVSRATVARALQRAIQDGLVRVCFAAEPEKMMQLEERLCEQYGLVEAIVVSAGNDAASRQTALARATASYLERALEDKMVVSLGTSRTLHEMTGIFSPSRQLPKCVFVEMLGGIASEDPRFDIYNVSWRLAESCGGAARHLFTPAVFDSVQAKEVMMHDARVAKTLQLAAESDMCLLAIGDTGINCPVFLMAHFDENDISELQSRGAVGEVIGRAYDLNGNPVNTKIDDRILGLDLPQINQLRFVVAVAGGKERELAVIGALRQGFVKVLITDSEIAEAVVSQADTSETVA